MVHNQVCYLKPQQTFLTSLGHESVLSFDNSKKNHCT